MNEVALGVLTALLRTTAFFSGAAIAVGLLLKFGRPASPVVHRAAWLLVLLTGWLWWRLPVTIPYVETAAEPVPPAVRVVAPQFAERRHVDIDPATSGGQATLDESSLLGQLPANQGPAAAVWANWPTAILGVWLSGMFVLVIVWIAGYLRSLRQLRAASPADEIWVRQWDDLCVAHDIRKTIPFRATADVGPLLCRTPSGLSLGRARRVVATTDAGRTPEHFAARTGALGAARPTEINHGSPAVAAAVV